MPEGPPFDDIRALLETLPQPDVGAQQDVKDILAKFGAAKRPLGRCDDAVEWLAGWQRKLPSVDCPLIAIFAGSHQIAKSVFGKPVIDGARHRVTQVTSGIAGVRGMAASLGAAFKVYEMGLDYPAEDFTQEPSLSERECAQAIAFGMEVVAEGADVIVLGNAGYGTATAAAAIVYGLYGGAPEYWAGGDRVSAKARVKAVKQAADVHKDALSDPLEVLRRFGGRDIAGLVGAILAARHQSIPIILDGFVVCAAAAILHEFDPDSIAHCLAGHESGEPSHAALLDRLGLMSLLNFGIGMGDGAGATLALSTLKTASAAIGTMSE